MRAMAKCYEPCVLPWLLTILKTLTMLVTNTGKSVWMVKNWRDECRALLGIGIMGACFQAPCCHTWTMTNGNALCSLMNFVFQHVTSIRSYKVTYWWYESL